MLGRIQVGQEVFVDCADSEEQYKAEFIGTLRNGEGDYEAVVRLFPGDSRLRAVHESRISTADKKKETTDIDQLKAELGLYRGYALHTNAGSCSKCEAPKPYGHICWHCGHGGGSRDMSGD